MDIEIELKDLNEKKACLKSIPPKIIKENSYICAESLVMIINKGILTKTFDNGLKLAELIPVHKCDDTISKENYRNISLLPVVAKIFEKVIQKQIGIYNL